MQTHKLKSRLSRVWFQYKYSLCNPRNHQSFKRFHLVKIVSNFQKFAHTTNMSASLRFKFKNDIEFSKLTMKCNKISVIDVKKAILKMKKQGRTSRFDLDIFDFYSQQKYEGESTLISKYTTLIVVRKPLLAGKQKVWEEPAKLFQNEKLSEEERLMAFLNDTSLDMYHPRYWKKINKRRPPPSYTCRKCKVKGHWINECTYEAPKNHFGEKMKRATGIPKSFLTKATQDTPGAKLDEMGQFVVNELEKKAYEEKKVEKPWWKEGQSS